MQVNAHLHVPIGELQLGDRLLRCFGVSCMLQLHLRFLCKSYGGIGRVALPVREHWLGTQAGCWSSSSHAVCVASLLSVSTHWISKEDACRMLSAGVQAAGPGSSM